MNMKKTILAMLTMALGGMDAAVINPKWSLQSKLQVIKSAGMLILLLISAVMLSCDPAPDNNGNKDTPHQTTITAFGKEATVIGDAALSTADFNTAKGKLEEAFAYIYTSVTTDPTSEQANQIQSKFNTMLNRAGFQIIIETGNAAPNANANKSMTIGVDYLLDNNVTPTITSGIMQKVAIDNAFADPYTPLYTNPATITLSFVSASGTPAAGSFNVTIKSDDTYTPAAWDAVVANVKTALETTYASSDVTPGDRINLRDVFGVADATVILKNDLAQNWEVKAGVTKGTLYIKTNAISTITASSYAAAAEAILQNNPATSQANAAPPQRRAFLALAREKSSYALGSAAI